MSVYCSKCGVENRDTARFCKHCAAPMPGAAGRTGLLPQHLVLEGRYLVECLIGQGGMAAVYRARDTRTQRLLAIKEMSDSIITRPAERQQAVVQFKHEAQMLARLEHPNLPKVSDVFSHDGKQYLVMDFVDGLTLDAAMYQNGRRPYAETDVVAWGIQLCDVLIYLHSQSPPIIFRDLKPSNIMVDRAGRVKLIDFGIARVLNPGSTRDTVAFGTLGYAAPEQMGNARSDIRTDIYALGVTLYELLTGYDPTTTPFNLRPIRQLNPGVSTLMELIVTRAIERAPDQRWSNANEIRQQWPAASTTGPLPLPGVVDRATRDTRRKTPPTQKLAAIIANWSTAQIALALTALLVLVAAGLWFGTPVLNQYTVLWDNVPSLALIGPLVYAALRKNWLPLIAHVLVALVGAVITGARMLPGGWTTWYLDITLVAAVVTGLLIEVWVRMLAHAVGVNREAAWQREFVWLSFMAIAVAVVFFAIRYGQTALNPIVWVTAGLLGALGWFLGDFVQRYLLLRQTGIRRGLGGGA